MNELKENPTFRIPKWSTKNIVGDKFWKEEDKDDFPFGSIKYWVDVAPMPGRWTKFVTVPKYEEG